VPTGLDNIVEELTNDLDVGQLQIGKPVGQIQWKTLSEPQSVGCLDGSLYHADHIICTLPLGVLKTFSSILFKPTLPLEKLQAIQNLGFGNPVKIYLSYKRPINRWLKSNLRPLGSLLQPSDLSSSSNPQRSWTQQVVEISQLPTSQHVLEIRVGGGYYDEIEKLPDATLLEQITTLLRQCLSNSKVPYPQAMLRSNWNSSACYLGGRPNEITSQLLHRLMERKKIYMVKAEHAGRLFLRFAICGMDPKPTDIEFAWTEIETQLTALSVEQQLDTRKPGEIADLTQHLTGLQLTDETLQR